MKIILLIDIQEGYMRDDFRQLPKDIEKHLEAMSYDLKIATRHVNKNDSLHKADIYIKTMTMFSNKSKIVDPIDKLADFVLIKSTYTALTPDVLKLFEKNDIKEVYLAGMNTETSILATAFDLFDRGIKPMILSKLCNSVYGPMMHQAALEIIRSAIGTECIIV